jgi:hypothetical protein
MEFFVSAVRPSSINSSAINHQVSGHDSGDSRSSLFVSFEYFAVQSPET